MITVIVSTTTITGQTVRIEGLEPADLPALQEVLRGFQIGSGSKQVTTLTDAHTAPRLAVVPDPHDAMHDRISQAEKSGRGPGQDEPPAVPVSTFCAVCFEQQVVTDSGATCPNGHGGADSLSYEDAKARREAAKKPGGRPPKGDGAPRRNARQGARQEAAQTPPPPAEPPPDREPGSDDEVEGEVVEEETAAPGPAAANGSHAPIGQLPPEIAEARRLSIVLSYLKDRGFSGEDLVEEAMRVKDQVGILAKATNPEERIRRAIVTL